jgi:hypothetical protein
VRPCGTRTSLTRRGESTEAKWINQQLTSNRKAWSGQKHVVSKADKAPVPGARGRSGKSCMAKADCLNPSQGGIRGSPQEKVLTPVFDVGGSGTISLQSFRRSLPVRNRKRRKGRPGARTEILGVTWGSPTAREGHGDGGTIVVGAREEVTSYMAKGSRESA